MGIALLALSGLFKTLSTPRRTQLVMPKRHLGRLHPVWAVRPAACTPPTPLLAHMTPTAPHLRVLRMNETGQGAECAGRMVISGRMADVCAELDRLVALETQQLKS